MTDVRINKVFPRVLTRTNVCAIMDSPNIGKEAVMDKQETKEEVLERVLMKLSKMTDEQVEKLILLAKEEGIDLISNEPRE